MNIPTTYYSTRIEEYPQVACNKTMGTLTFVLQHISQGLFGIVTDLCEASPS